MEPERWRRAEELFHRAVVLEGAAREALLDVECGADGELRAEIEKLLRCDGQEGDAFSRVEVRPSRALVDPLIGRVLGAYRVTERIAAGGMGVVYRAERADGLFRQDVAIKLIRAERATEWMLRRFEFERRTLAALQHPCIARLYDGGTADDGCPYFVMELVQGDPIDRYCARERATVPARLRLFVQVCRAVQFAHQSLVVHCDLKPANILIDERGLPRLLDFGIARLLEDAPGDTKPTGPGTMARVLTPEYASPEQLAGSAATTSIDVYSLGVVLYELLTGRRPFESESRGAAEWERLIRERAPERPSTVVRRAAVEPLAIEAAASLRSSPAALRRALRGDLDRIVLMALRKEPERRYASVQEFADDIERHLAGRPVRARDNALSYLALRFVQRHRIGVAASCAVLAALLFALFSARRSERIANAEAIHARLEADSFEGVADFLMDAFLPVQPAQDEEWHARARTRLAMHAERVRRQFAGTDHTRANMLDALGEVALRLELFDDANVLVREALAIREQAFGAQSLEYARSLRALGQLAYDVGDFDAAETSFREALAIHRAEARSLHADIAGRANDLAATLRALGRIEEAEALHREALALRREAEDGSLPVAESLNNLAAVHIERGEFDTAIEVLREALSTRAAVLGDEHLLTLQTRSNLASTLWRAGERTEVLELMAAAERGYRALGGDGERELAVTLANHATMQLALRDLDGAAASLDEALSLQRKRLGNDHPSLAETLSTLAILHHSRRHDDQARECWLEVLRIRKTSAVAPQALAEALYGYGVFQFDRREHAQAVSSVEEALALHRGANVGDPAALGRVLYVLGACRARLGERTVAREHLNEALTWLRQVPGATEAECLRVESELRKLSPESDG